MIVAKFGGTSLATAENIKKACAIQLSDSRRKIMVVSAPGKRFKQDVKVTDLLIDLCEKAYKGQDYQAALDLVLARFKELSTGLRLNAEVFESVETDLKSRLQKTDLPYEKYLDLLKAAGEDNSAKTIAAYLKTLIPDAVYLNPKTAGMLLSDESGNAVVLPKAYENLKNLKGIKGVGVFPGFFGYSESGEVVTFGRGGSDITGAILAAAVGAEVYENFTDVDSVFAINPALNPQAVAVPQITYREMRELAYAGFSVLHEESVEPALRARIPIHIRNMFNPSSAGTKIVNERDASAFPVAGIAGTDGFCIFTVHKFLMNREAGFARRLFEIFENEKLSFDRAPSGVDAIASIFKQQQLTEQKEKQLFEQIYSQLNTDSMQITKDIAIIMVVGEGLFGLKNALSRAVDALAAEDISIEALNICRQNSVSMWIGVKSAYLNRAITALYKEFFIQTKS